MVSQNSATAVTMLSTGAACFLAYLAVKYFLNRRWVNVGRLRLIYIHPVKSTRGRSVEWADADETGLHQRDLMDREFMVATTDLDGQGCHKMVNIFIHPKLLLLEAEKKDGRYLTLKQLAGTDVTIATDSHEVDLFNVGSSQNLIRVNLFDQIVEVLDCGDEVAAWLSNRIGTSCRLAWQHTELVEPRIIDLDPSVGCLIGPPRYGVKTSLVDLSNHMLATDSSLADLNRRINQQPEFTMRHFRPTIVVADKGIPAFDEDNWEVIRIGEAQFTNVKACTRCVVTTIDPSTGLKRSGYEPLKTLRKFRLGSGPKVAQFDKNSPRFGIYLALDKPGRLEVGQDVFVRYHTS